MPQIRPARIRGRPAGAATLQRKRLLDAAQELLPVGEEGFSLRQIALRAGVTPPLAHYYFDNRDGLRRALVAERASPLVDGLLASAREHASQPLSALSRLMQRLIRLCAQDAFLRCCLLQPAGAPLRARLRDALHELLQHAQGAARLRADLAPSYLAETLLGLCLCPFLDADPGEDSGERAAALAVKHMSLLQDGLRPR